jgi:hypothetical protein
MLIKAVTQCILSISLRHTDSVRRDHGEPPNFKHTSLPHNDCLISTSVACSFSVRTGGRLCVFCLVILLDVCLHVTGAAGAGLPVPTTRLFVQSGAWD